MSPIIALDCLGRPEALAPGKHVMVSEALYPPAPPNVPAEITRLDRACRLRLVAMTGGLFLPAGEVTA